MSKPTLDELANKYGTDKGTLFDGACKHGYAPFYDELFSGIRNNNINLLEIGVWLELCSGGESIRMWTDYFEQGQIYTFDIRDMKNHPAIQNNNRVVFYRGDQGNRQDLQAMYENFNTPSFDIVIEDGSHNADHQMISFAQVFPYVKSKGIYIIEDITIPGRSNCNGMNNDETYQTIYNFSKTMDFSSRYITDIEKTYIQNNIDKTILHPDIKNEWITAIIFKK